MLASKGRREESVAIGGGQTVSGKEQIDLCAAGAGDRGQPLLEGGLDADQTRLVVHQQLDIARRHAKRSGCVIDILGVTVGEACRRRVLVALQSDDDGDGGRLWSDRDVTWV